MRKAISCDPAGIAKNDIKEYTKKRITCTWDASEWPHFEYVVVHESQWNHNAVNPSSGACGIPQALPCSKLGTTDPYEQIDWMIEYVEDRYVTPYKAHQWHVAHNWY